MQNFGIINETFKNILIESIGVKGAEKNKAVFKKYVNALKSNSALRAQYHIYNNIENKVETDKVKSLEYIKESILILKKIGREEIIKENTLLVNFLIKNGYNITKEDYPHKSLHEDINTLIMTKKNTKNLDSIMESAYKISDYINTNVSVLKEEAPKEYYSNKAVGEIMTHKFNLKYANLSENEKTILKSMFTNDDKGKEEIYNKMVTECVELVNNNLIKCNIEEKDKLLQVKDKLLRLKFINVDFISEITKIINLKNTLI